MRSRRVVLAALVAGCAGNVPAPAPAPSEAMPELRIQQRSGAEAPTPEATAIPELALDGRRVTLTAADADLRVLLPLLAEAAGVSLVLGPDARGTVSVHFEDMDAMAAIRQVLGQAGLTIVAPLQPPDRPTVFYTMPMDVDELTAEQIQAHFGVTAEVARFLVESRVPPDGPG